jgi:hypothetical protein
MTLSRIGKWAVITSIGLGNVRAQMLVNSSVHVRDVFTFDRRSQCSEAL